MYKKTIEGVQRKFSGQAPNPNSKIGKYPRVNPDFPSVNPSDNFHKNLIRVDSEMPFAKPKGAEVGGMITAENIPTRFMRSPILARASSQKFSKKSFSGLLRVD